MMVLCMTLFWSYTEVSVTFIINMIWYLFTKNMKTVVFMIWSFIDKYKMNVNGLESKTRKRDHRSAIGNTNMKEESKFKRGEF